MLLQQPGLIASGLAVLVDRTVIYVSLHKILEHMASVGQLRMVTGVLVRHLADGVKLADFRVDHGYA